jgi:hypothetical protein
LLFPEVPFEKLVISFRSPESKRGDLLEQPHNLQCRILWRVTSEEMDEEVDVVFIRFYLHDLEAFLMRELACFGLTGRNHDRYCLAVF